jgi:tRNA1(Val) A37 N6-methylase TrmN6
MPMPAERGGVSEDAILGGRLVLRQPRLGHRVGHDAILLAAATDARMGEHAVDLGAGVGAAGLALAHRVEGLTIALVEIDPELAALAGENAKRNGLAERVRAVNLDVTATPRLFTDAGLAAGSAARVLMNPPFNAPHHPSSNLRRRMAHAASQDTLGQWVRTAARLLGPDGTLTLIWRADGLLEVLTTLEGGFGALAILPVHPKPGMPAIRVLVRAVKGNRAPAALLPGLVLNDAAGKPTAEAEAVLRENAPLRMMT